MSKIKNRGFASFSLSKRKKVAASGGAASHKKGVAHKWNSAEAILAGKKGKKRKPIIQA